LDFDGKLESVKSFFQPNVILTGLESTEECEIEGFRKALGFALPSIKQMNSNSLVIDGIQFKPEQCAAMVEALILGLYEYKDEKINPLVSIVILCEETKVGAYKNIINKSVIQCEAANLTRKIAASPANIMKPKDIAAIAKQVASDHNLSINILGEEDMKKEGMEALLAVSSGSAVEAQLICLKYEHEEADETIAFVGKALTFDAGGISLKPSKTMKDMKFDKSGGAAVLGAIKAVAQLKPKVNVVAVIPSSENVIGSAAFRPGDILKASNGVTIEVTDTDAEGRLILCDALAYCVKKYKPNKMINIATLTGAVIHGLGRTVAAVMGNSDGVCNELIEAGSTVHERLWQMPLYDDHRKLMESQYADIINLNEGREAGLVQGGVFLREFVADTDWAAIDIGGTAWNYRFSPYIKDNCASGYGARLLSQWALNCAKQ
jgi:leucyl aminopeptidase